MAVMRIERKGDLKVLAEKLGVRHDWHEPDEQDVYVKIAGQSFDNAGFWPCPEALYEEIHVTVYQNYEPVAQVNLATLFALAAQ